MGQRLKIYVSGIGWVYVGAGTQGYQGNQGAQGPQGSQGINAELIRGVNVAPTGVSDLDILMYRGISSAYEQTSLDEIIDLGRTAISGTVIDWSLKTEFTKTVTSPTTFTETNIVQNKVIVLWITGNYSITWPSSWNVEKGSEDYDGTVMNKIVAHCKEDGTDEVWYYITQLG